MPGTMIDPAMQRQLLTVSQLTTAIKSLLETQFSFVWVTGEISNLRIPVSGHMYFTLKDQNAQISGVLFRGQARSLKFRLEDGMQIMGMGRVSVYEPRGTYQIIFEYMEPKGIGALQVAFEQLKARLSDEGLFDASHKQPLPFLPSRIGLITSPTGAVVYDMLDIIGRRFPGIPIDIIPVSVQGPDAQASITRAIELLNEVNRADVAILARGGGSLEDLQAFNSEAVARAVFASRIPIISAVGHETDVTIADYVADHRAPTPSAAAEIVVPVKSDLRREIRRLSISLVELMDSHIAHKRDTLKLLSHRLVDPKRKLQDFRIHLDNLIQRMVQSLKNSVAKRKDHLRFRTDALCTVSPLNRIKLLRSELSRLSGRLVSGMGKQLSQRHTRYRILSGRLQSLDPNAVLSRGYSITRRLSDGHIIRNCEEVTLQQKVQITLAKGALVCQVEEKT